MIFFTPAFLTGAILFATPPILNNGDKAIQGVLVASADISKMPYDEAFALLEEKAENFLNSQITIRTKDGYEIKVTPQQMGIDLNVEKTLANAYKHGRGPNLPVKLTEQVRALFFGIKEPMYVEIDKKHFSGFVTNTLAPIHRPAKNTTFKYNTDTEKFEQIEAIDGKIIDLPEFFDLAISRSQALSQEEIIVSQHNDLPLVKTEGILEAKNTAEDIIESGPYTIEALDKSWEVEKEDLASWISFIPIRDTSEQKHALSAVISSKYIEDYLLQFVPGLQIEPVNAKFNLNNGKVEAFSLAKEGKALDVAESARIVKESIENGNPVSILAFNDILPEITSENIDNLGINTLIGKGESDYAGSPNNRIHNIKVGFDKYQGILIAPGEEFSFNQNLGPVNAASGYLPELVILQDRTVPQYGGGLCQVSTTLFRAAVNAGLEITQRSAHSFVVQYYGTPGFDATIYPPNPDLKFKNNTPGYMLIQYKITGTKLTFELYGQDDGRRVEIDGPHIYDRQANGAMKAWVKQTVYDKNDNVMEEQTFYSNYKSPSLYPVNRNPLE